MSWIMLIYKLPRSKTSALKVALWRKLKKIGVYFAQDSVCILPFSERNLERLEWIAAELRDAGGDSSVWEARTFSEAHEREMREYFLEQVNVHYRRIIDEARSCNSKKSLGKLWAQFNTVKANDYLKSPLAVEAGAECEKRALELRGEV